MATALTSGAVQRQRRQPRTFVLPAVAAVGIAAMAATAWTIAKSQTLVWPTEMAFWNAATGLAWIGAGIFIWRGRPTSPMGPLAAGYGFAYVGYALSASTDRLEFTLGMTAWAATIVASAYVYLAVPNGRLESRLERWFMATFALCAAGLWLGILAVSQVLPAAGGEIECATRCPHNAIQLVSGHTGVGRALATALALVLALLAIGVAMFVFSKARSPSRLRRRTMTPLAVGVILEVIAFVSQLILPPVYPGAKQAVLIATYLAGLAIPAALLLGLASGRAFAARSLGRIAMSASETPMTPVACRT